MKNLTQEELKKYLHYNPETGIFTRAISRGNVKAGSTSSYIRPDKYLSISVTGTQYLAHRLVWLYVYGYVPENEIDHINGIRSDNRIKNLRHVSKFCNRQNCSVNKNNKSGFPGVSWSNSERCWRATIMINWKQIFIGYFPTALEAALARYNFEVVDPRWTCNHRSKLTQAIKKAWPSFNPKP